MIIRSLPQKSQHAASLRLRLAVLLALTLGLGLFACSDVSVPDCAWTETCGGGGAVGATRADAAGSAGAEAKAEAGAGGGSDGSDAGAGAGGGDAGRGGAGGGGNGGTGGTAGGAGQGEAGAAGGPNKLQINPEVLPAPCTATYYSTSLSVLNGTAPYKWQILPPVDTWHVTGDPVAHGARATLAGDSPTVPQTVSIEVEDATGEHGTTTYSIVPRTACWFAYTALETDGPQLHVVDPVLVSLPPLALGHNQGVYDFAFSPDGKYLVYRFGADAGIPKGKHLALLSLSAWTDELLPFGEDAVTAFAWSPDSSVLAVSFLSGGVSYLGGVRLSASTKPAELIPVQAAVDSDLYWFGSSRVALYASGTSDPINPGQLDPDPGEVTAFYAQLGESGFEPVVISTDTFYDIPVVLQPAEDGFFMISVTAPPYMQFNWINSSGPSGALHGDRFVAPSGHFTASVITGNELRIFRAEDDSNVATSAVTQTCPKLLTWAKGTERIACVADVAPESDGNSHSEIRIFDLDSANNLRMSTIQDYCVKNMGSSSAASSCAALEYDYTQASADQEPRVFSATGRYMAFTTDPPDTSTNYLYWADLSGSSPIIKQKHASTTTDPPAVSSARLAFSPDEHYLLQQLGNVLSVHAADEAADSFGASLLWFRDDSAETSTRCSEDFASAPDRWCGGAALPSSFTWSPDSKFSAYRSVDATTAKSTLTVADFAQFPAVAHQSVLAPDCAQQCSGQFAFQPQPVAIPPSSQ